LAQHGFFRLTLNQNVLPMPGVLSAPASPPISCASFLVMASPRPVPPYFA
jgi:hypothetical protein